MLHNTLRSNMTQYSKIRRYDAFKHNISTHYGKIQINHSRIQLATKQFCEIFDVIRFDAILYTLKSLRTWVSCSFPKWVKLHRSRPKVSWQENKWNPAEPLFLIKKHDRYKPELFHTSGKFNCFTKNKTGSQTTKAIKSRDGKQANQLKSD